MYTIFLFVLLLVSLPVQVFIALAIALSSGLPIIYRQKRVGKNGKTFILIKFRTMVPGAGVMQKKFYPLNEAHGPVFKIRHDPRYTPIGKFLAHTGADELPQLYNVLRGDMALFGPRPLPVDEAAKLTPWQQARHRIKPGMFSPWILEGYHQTSFDAWMRSDLAYAQVKSFGYDVRLAARAAIFLTRLFLSEVGKRT